MNKQTFGQRLKNRRVALGMTQEVLSERATVVMRRLVADEKMDVILQSLSKSSVSHLEHDRHDPSILALRALAEVLEVSFNWLILGDDGRGEYVESIAHWASKIPESKRKILESVARDFFDASQPQ